MIDDVSDEPILRFQDGDNRNAGRAVFSYDTGDYTIHFYAPWYSSYRWVEIEK